MFHTGQQRAILATQEGRASHALQDNAYMLSREFASSGSLLVS
jgi:hypothetical protein